MAATDKELCKTMSQLCEKLSRSDQCLDQMIRESFSQGHKMLQILKDEVQQLAARQQDLKGELYESLKPFYESGDDRDIHTLDLFQLPGEILGVIGTKGKDEINLVGLVVGLKELKQRGDENNEKVLELMLDFDILPNFCKEFLTESDLHDETVKKEKSEQRLKGKEKIRVLSLKDIAIEVYGFPSDVALQIEASLQHRKLIQYEFEYFREEAEDVSDPWLQETEMEVMERSWARVNKLKRMFKELKEKIYEKPEVIDLSAVAESLGVPFLRVIRNWIFHIEYALFNLIYEYYHALKSYETAEAVFQVYRAKLENFKEWNNGKVPMTVYKTIEMLENPREYKAMGVVIKIPAVYRRGSGRLYENVKMDDLMDPVHNTILRMTAALETYGKLAITENDSASIGNTLEASEEEVKDFQGLVAMALQGAFPRP